jgi:2,3-dihydroxyphenylpropionate 1,2-dioxygenase
MIRLICVSHSPILNLQSDTSPRKPEVEAVYRELADEMRDYDPTLVILFAPDHYNGFFYDLMPAFCFGLRGEAVGDYSSAKGTYRIPEDKTLACVDAVRAAGFDPAVSYRMQLDHGFSQPLAYLFGGVDRVPVIPIYINCVSPPRPGMARVRALGAAIGRWAAGLDERVLLIGSGGLSHDPPLPAMPAAAPEVFEMLVAGRNPTPEGRRQREERTLAMAGLFAKGEGPLQRLNPEWDRWMIDRLLAGDLAAVESQNDDEITRQGGRSGHETRTWLAAFGAMQAAGPYAGQLHYYRDVPEWIVGMGMVSARTR